MSGKYTNVDWKEDYRTVNKELYLTRKELQYNQLYAQAAFELYDESSQVSHSMMVLKGIHVELLSDLLKYQAKNPGTAIANRERLDLLAKHIDQIALVQTDNYALRWNAKKMREEIWRLMQENANLKHQLHMTTCAKNELPEDRI